MNKTEALLKLAEISTNSRLIVTPNPNGVLDIMARRSLGTEDKVEKIVTDFCSKVDALRAECPEACIPDTVSWDIYDDDVVDAVVSYRAAAYRYALNTARSKYDG